MAGLLSCLLTCLLGGWLAFLFAYLLVGWLACSLVYWLTCWMAGMLTCLVTCLLDGWLFFRNKSPAGCDKASFIQGAFSTSGDPGENATFYSLPETIAHTSGTLYCRFKCIHQPNKDGTGTVTITFTNSSVTNNDLDITINFGGPLP